MPWISSRNRLLETKLKLGDAILDYAMIAICKEQRATVTHPGSSAAGNRMVSLAKQLIDEAVCCSRLLSLRESSLKLDDRHAAIQALGLSG